MTVFFTENTENNTMHSVQLPTFLYTFNATSKVSL